MFQTFILKLKQIIQDETLRKRVFFVLGAFFIFRFLANIPIPGVNVQALQDFFNNNQFLGLLNMFSGGGLSNLSIVMLGVAPYITAAIIMQLMTIMSPKLKAMYQEEGEAGRRKFTQYSRLLTVPLALIQGFGFFTLLQKQGIIADLGLWLLITNVLVIVAGSIFLMWIGELITEFGIGNGVSLIIFAGIVSRLPSTIGELVFNFQVGQIPMFLAFGGAALLIIAGIVAVSQAERLIPVTYAKKARGSKVYGGISTYLPLKLNQAGVIPIIFGLSILLFPQMILNFLQSAGNDLVASVSSGILTIFENGWVYASLYFILVFLFTYFYTAVTFDPDTISNNLQKSGAFIPGIRPGHKTSEYLAKIITRITFFGAMFLGLVAVLPLIMKAVTGIASLAIGGLALLIAVEVVLDLVKKIDAQISLKEY